MTDANIKQLIERLEALEAPCRECDIEVARFKYGRDAVRRGGLGWRKDAIIVPCCPGWEIMPSYTASLDAAMTLVPEGNFDQDWGRSTRYKSEGFKLWQVRIALETVEQDPQELGPVALGEHNTPAIALCIAALRAALEARGLEIKEKG